MSTDDLVDRLARATGPSRELDAEITAALLLYTGPHDWVRRWRGEWVAINGLVHLQGDGGSAGNFVPLPLTGSLDAALALVPDGYDWIVSRTNDGLTIHACVGNTEMHFANTPPAALCIAALKARARPGSEG